MPKTLNGKEVIVNGKSFIEAYVCDEQKHYAEDVVNQQSYSGHTNKKNHEV